MLRIERSENGKIVFTLSGQMDNENMAELEKSLIERALSQAQGNKSKAAELLGINRRLLYEKLKQYEI